VGGKWVAVCRVQAGDQVVWVEDTGRPRRQRRHGLKLRLALAVRLSFFDAPALTKVWPFLTKIDELFTKEISIYEIHTKTI
jgi:hypothetical protein